MTATIAAVFPRRPWRQRKRRVLTPSFFSVRPVISRSSKFSRLCNKCIVDPVFDQVSPLFEYAPGTWGPSEASRLAADLGGWNDRQPGS